MGTQGSSTLKINLLLNISVDNPNYFDADFNYINVTGMRVLPVWTGGGCGMHPAPPSQAPTQVGCVRLEAS